MTGLTILFILLIIAAAAGIVFVTMKPKKKLKTDTIYTDALNAMVSNDKKTAISLLKEVVRNNSDHIDAYMQLGNILRDIHPEQALKIHQSLTVRPNLSKSRKVDIHMALALDYQKLGLFPQSRREAEIMMNLDRRNLEATEFLLSIAVKERNWPLAAKYAKSVQRINSTQDKDQLAQFQMYDGLDSLDQGDRNAALSHFKRAVKISPNFGESYLHIGNVYESDRDLIKAIEYWEKYAMLSPSNAKKVFNKIESALFDLGRFSEVENFYNRILEKDSANLEALAKLANVLEEKGDRQAALSLVDSALMKNQSSLEIRLMKLKLSLSVKQPHELANQVDELRSLVSDSED